MDIGIVGFAGHLVPGFAVLATLLLAIRSAERGALCSQRMLTAGVIGLLGALVGGQTLTWALGLLSSASPSFLAGGFSTMGALGGAFLAGAGYLRARGEPVLRYADNAVAGVALGYAIIRLVCLVEGHCFGTVSNVPWALRYGVDSPAFEEHLSAGLIDVSAAHSLAVHPVQLYHSALGVSLFALLTYMRVSQPGSRFALALLGYGAGRFILQFFRGDTGVSLGLLDITQVLCVAMALAGAAIFYVGGVRASASGRRLTA